LQGGVVGQNDRLTRAEVLDADKSGRLLLHQDVILGNIGVANHAARDSAALGATADLQCPGGVLQVACFLASRDLEPKHVAGDSGDIGLNEAPILLYAPSPFLYE